jgi:hypothetical protein
MLKKDRFLRIDLNRRVAFLDAVRTNEKEKFSQWEDTYKTTAVISPMNGKSILRNVVEDRPFQQATFYCACR